MTSQRWQLERALWRRGLRVGVQLPTQAPSVDVYPVVLPDDVEAAAVERKLPEIAGRLNVPAIRGAWANGHYSLELPRAKRQRVDYGRLELPATGAALPWLLGITNSGRAFLTDVAAMPHMLIAGMTGAGKSNSVTAALAHLLTVRTPSQVQVLLLDPKQVELLPFVDSPHTLAHVVEPAAMVSTLETLASEMSRRYALFARVGAKDLASYNSKADDALPAIVCVVDELGLLMDSHAKVLEPVLLALLQTARASGIHLILGTQRPDGDVLRARLRANLPARVCFRVPDGASSRLIVDDDAGAGLLGAGDGLYLDSTGNLCRFQAPFMEDKALHKALTFANKHPVTDFQLDGLQDVATSLPSLEGMSRIDAAVLLCEGLEWINSSTLINAGICDSSTVAKGVLKQLRDMGLVGTNNASMKASPVRRRQVAPVQTQTVPDGTQTDKQADRYPTRTAADGLDRLSGRRLGLVN